jgi:hypothetical protein
MDDFKFPLTAEAPEALVLNGVAHVQLRGVDFATVEPRCTELKLVADDAAGRIIAGKPYSANVTVENGKQEGLAKIDLAVAGQKTTRWLWLQTGEKKEVVFKGLIAPAEGSHEVRCGDVTQSLRVAEEGEK